ncbi:hypothetical protein ACKI2N_028560 [Cupriavidus sp. 30B13]|uniref:hypothetical protein n=1 Tax=Cupriavidus sp. 30B13 TaxID=3384241 RepID=UPI003CF2AB99
MSRRALLAALLLACLLAALPALAEGPGSMARAHLEPAGPVAAGQPVRLVVDALTTNWFTQAPAYPVLDIPGAIVSPPGDDAGNLSEDIGGRRWFGVSRTYIVTPQGGGSLAIPALELTLHVGEVDGAVKVSTPPLTLAVREVPRPPGAEHAVGTTRLEVRQTLDRDLGALRQGDAFTRAIEISADGVQAMLLPPTAFGPVSGLAVYPKAPRVEDLSRERQGFIGGHRIDAATYVVQRPGHYTLPGVSVQWWDVRAGRLRTASVPPLRFSAAAQPDYRPPVAIPGEPALAQAGGISRLGARQLAGALVAAALLGFAGWLLLPRWRRWRARRLARRRQRRLAREGSEPVAFARLRRALRRRPPAPAEVAARLYAWLDRVPALADKPATLAGAARAAARSVFAQAGRQWLAARYGGAAPDPVVDTALARSLGEARKALAPAPARPGRARRLPPLNPGG